MISISSIFFRILNAGIIFGIIWYAFRKYALGKINQQIAQEKAAAQSKQLQKEMLEMECVSMGQAIEAQEAFGKKLLERIDRWMEVLAHKQEEQRAFGQERVKYSHERQLAQFENAQEALMHKKIVQPAIAQARTELIKKFSDEKEGRMFLEKLISNLDKRTHE